MVKFRLPSALARNSWRTFNVSLFLIVIGMVPLILSVTSRTRLDVVFLAGLGLVCVGGTLFLISSCVAVCDHIQNGPRLPPRVVVVSSVEPVWAIDAPPSYDEAVANIHQLTPSRSPSVRDATTSSLAVVGESATVSVMDGAATTNVTADTAKAKCVILTVTEPKSSVC